MKTKITLILMVLLVAGCELRSEINKCVDAKLTIIVDQECMAINQGKNEKAESTHVENHSDHLPAYVPRFGRTRPLVVIVGENYYTELTDYVVPYGILMASGAAEVMALATQSGPIRMFPAPVNVQPQATTAAFDVSHPEGADYVIVPAVHRDTDPTLIAWVKSQAQKGATVVGVCDGVWVVARAGLLDGRKATGHWYSRSDLRTKFPQTDWVSNRRYVSDGKVVTTTGVTATIPTSLALVEAIVGHERAKALALSLGGDGMNWSSAHQSERFNLDWSHRFTIASNFLAFWSHEEVGIAIEPGVDEIALALQAEVYSATYKSTAYTVFDQAGPLKTKRGLMIEPNRTRSNAPSRMLTPVDATRPLRALDDTLKEIGADYGPRTRAWVSLQMEYRGN
jgi:putative intracellular protease/amidase